MTKRFCDICSCEVDQFLDRHPAEASFGNGPTWISWGKAIQQQIVVTVNFSFRTHPTGFGGPPDLCKKCRLDLLRRLIQRTEEQK